MKMTSSAFLLALAAALLALAAAERVQFKPCKAPDAMKNCEVHWVDINPCPEAKEEDEDDQPCRAKKGKISTIKFNFTPKVASESLAVKVFWASATGDLKFEGINEDACAATSCPLTADHAQDFTFALTVPKTTASRPYKVKWDVRGINSDLQCCFTTNIRVH